MVDPIPFARKEVFARIGDFAFELLTLVPDRIDWETGYRWAKQEPISSLPVHHYLGSTDKDRLGPNESKRTISRVLYPEISGRIDHLKKLRDMAAAGKPQRLVYADTKLGENLGLWIILKIKETRTILHADGIPKRIEFSIDLEAYAQPPAQ
ncbi:MAG TPA: phage tail protein [Oligoflexus sp.]|uniref:phage tail protein n=1 Tax=Oligoflexus sp. TaxID=1971216 RepID=UPI002D4D6831|nr:phage tail protein [Oligoflexus sp.]HYX32205.1 phage tail protein [Oligoflexus sp.]